MTIYWTMNSVPELTGLDKAEKKRLFKEVYKVGRQRLGIKQVLLRSFVALAIGIAVIYALDPIKYLGTGFIDGLLGGAIIGGLIGMLFVVLVQGPAIDKGREWLREQGYPKNS